jgi:hypothetical protein
MEKAFAGLHRPSQGRKTKFPTNQNTKIPTLNSPTQEMVKTLNNFRKYGRKKNDFKYSVEYSGEVNSTKPELIFT